ncbi:MAG: DUF5916 domain-containing protein [Opitutaceae bacterium]|nr:DUF5916 domain-containing protein [Opitutaceae bacterium]
MPYPSQSPFMEDTAFPCAKGHRQGSLFRDLPTGNRSEPAAPSRAVALLVSLLLGLASLVPAVAATPSLELRPAEVPPEIDGILDDPVWRTAAHSDAFRQVSPLEDAEPNERTEVWATCDGNNIYVAVRLHDSQASRIPAVNMQHDKDDDSDDSVLVTFDPFDRASDGYFFGLTAAGGRYEGTIEDNSTQSFDWDGLWQGRATVDASGWSAEFAIPVKSLSFDPTNAIWGFNVSRTIARSKEIIRWSGTSRSRDVTYLPDQGELRNITGLRQGRGFDVKPFASLTRRSNPAPDERKLELKPGLDLVWHVTPSLAATLTVNTDFADAEVDERQVNLGRFPLFYPEKRTFFLQDAPLFTFGAIQETPKPYYSRRIGRAADGSRIDLLGGIKLTGRAGPWTIGLLDVQIDKHAGVDSTNLLVGKVARQVLEESNTGIIFTRGDPRSNGNHSLVGADFNYLNSRLPGNRTLILGASLQHTDSDYRHAADDCFRFGADFPNEPLLLSYRYKYIGENYDPALGFVDRINIQSCDLTTRYRWYPARNGIRRIDALFVGNLIMDLPGRRRLDYTVNFPDIDLETRNGDLFHLDWETHRELLETPFAIRPTIIIPTGDYQWGILNVTATTSYSRPFNLGLEFHHGDFYAGDSRDYKVSCGWRPSRHIDLTTGFELNRIRLPQGDFDVHLGSLKTVYTFTPDLQLSLLAQYDNLSADLGLNFRFKWIVQPGNEIYFVVNQGYDTSLDRFRPTTNETVLKGAWTHRF